MGADNLYKAMVKDYLESKGYVSEDCSYILDSEQSVIDRFLTLEKNKELENISMDLQNVLEQIKKG